MGNFRMPEVSVISSWCVRTRDDKPISHLKTNAKSRDSQLKQLSLPGLDQALREGIELVDLYLLDHHEVPIYAAAAGIGADWNRWKKESEENPTGDLPSTGTFATPVSFLASLERSHLDRIANFLQQRLAQQFEGRGIGRRPRITGIATHFPYLSLPAEECEDADQRRLESVKAIRAALYLAHQLGAYCVEAVCGTWVALPRGGPNISPREYRELRRQALLKSLTDVFTLEGHIPLERIGPPYLALEIEPGPAYLLNSAKEFEVLHDQLPASIRQWVGLNVDLAHFFLVGLHRPDILPQRFHPLLFHSHVADHAGDSRMGGVHASDLVPGSFHKFSHYQPWLKFLCDKDLAPNFSGVIAIEQEASFQLEDIVAARSIVQRWLAKCGEDTDRSAWEWAADWPHEGAFLVIDIGNSTREFLGGKDLNDEESQDTAARLLGAVIEALCYAVREAGGSALNFTGDGLLILFEERLQPGMAATRADEFAHKAFDIVSAAVQQRIGIKALTLRCGLHWGRCYIPTDGPLRDNGIGRDVVYAARLCSWLGDTIEKAAPRREDDDPEKELLPTESVQIGATQSFVARYESEGQPTGRWQYWGKPPFKGLPMVRVFLRNKNK